MLTQFARVSEQTKVSYRKARITQTARYLRGGSVLKGDIFGAPGGIETTIDVDSDEPPEKIARVVRMAENSCFTIQSLMQSMEVTAKATLNGQPLEY